MYYYIDENFVIKSETFYVIHNIKCSIARKEQKNSYVGLMTSHKDGD